MVTTSDLTLYRYSPENMPEDDLRKLFVGRVELLESLFKEIKDAAKKKTPRFYLIVGPRGIGKSHFLALLFYEIRNKLDSLIIPIKLAEEEYSVFRASDFFLRILEEKKEDASDILSLKNEDEILDAAIEKLKQESKKNKKQYIILVENLHELFRQMETEEVQKLRSIFQKYDIFSVVATAPMIFPGISEHDEPFYDFFRIQHLGEFSLEEMMVFIKKIAELEKNSTFIDEFEKYEERIHGIEHLAGGSPRLVILFYEMITRGELENVEKAFFKIIDEHTPYYQEIFQLLTGQKRRIFDIIIAADGPITPKQISEKARIDLRIVNTQLRRLETDGYVRSRPMGRYTKYEVRERLFRLWREMRQPLGRKRISALLDFLQHWYTPKERKELFEGKYELLEKGDRGVLKEICYYAEALPPEFKADALLKLAPILLEHREYEEAAYEIQKLREISVQNKDKELKSKIPVYEMLHEGSQLLSEKRNDEALEFFNKVLEINPKDEYALSRKGAALINLGRYEEAITVLDEVLKINPKHEISLSNKGLALGNLDRNEDAIAVLDKVLKINPKDEYALLMKGAALGNLGRYEEALELFDEALKINPKNEIAMSNKGTALGNLGRHEEALAVFDEIIKINPKYEKALLGKGGALILLGRQEEALEIFDEIIKINSKHEGALLGKGLALDNLGRNEEALEIFDEIIKINPKHEGALSRKGLTLGYFGRYEEALVVFDEVIKINPKNEEALSWKGIALVKLGRHEDAIAVSDEVIKINPKNEEAFFMKGCALTLLGRNEDALEVFDDVLKINPMDEFALNNFIIASLNIAINELKANNIGSATKLIGKANDKGVKLETEAFNSLIIDFLNECADSGLSVIKTAVEETIKLQGEEYRELIRPIINAIEIIETEDIQRYYDLQVEEREIVADIVRKICKSDELIPEEIRRKESL